MKIIVLGAGLIGKVAAKYLVEDVNFEVSVADKNPEQIELLMKNNRINGKVVDLSKKGAIKNLVKDYDMVLGAVPGFLGMHMMKEVLEAGKNIVDISFTPDDYSVLDELAKKNGVTAVVDCGVAPGMSNILASHAARELDKAESLLILVGGLPQVRQWPYEYKIVFSPIDVIEEYTRPARFVENGRVVTKEALTDIELVDFPLIGTLEAFNTDGLRTLTKTLNIPNMKEKTLRFPGHTEKMKILKETGFFNKKPIEVNNLKVRPVDVTAKLLFPMWKLKKGEKDFTVMRVEVNGKKKGRPTKIKYSLLDYFDEKTATTSMARTTACPAAIIAKLVAKQQFIYKGICPPEYIGNKPELFKILLEELEKKGIVYEKFVEES